MNQQTVIDKLEGLAEMWGKDIDACGDKIEKAPVQDGQTTVDKAALVREGRALWLCFNGLKDVIRQIKGSEQRVWWKISVTVPVVGKSKQEIQAVIEEAMQELCWTDVVVDVREESA